MKHNLERASAHLSFSELACHDSARTPYPLEYINDGRCQELAEVFESLREHLGGRGLRVTSAFRTPAHQRKVNPGTRRSQHVLGKALDIQCPSWYSSQDQFRADVANWARNLEPRVGGIGFYNNFVHIDTRPRSKGRKPVTWASNRTLVP